MLCHSVSPKKTVYFIFLEWSDLRFMDCSQCTFMFVVLCLFNSLVPGRSGCDFKISIFNNAVLIGILDLLIIMPSDECHRTSLTVSPTLVQVAIIWTYVDQVKRHYGIIWSQRVNSLSFRSSNVYGKTRSYRLTHWPLVTQYGILYRGQFGSGNG